MTLILSGTDGLSDVDGSAATPAIKGTDANTGIFFPAADTVAMSTGGSERMRIDTSGQLGVGFTPLDTQGNLQVYKAISGGAPATSGTTDANQVFAINEASVQTSFGAYVNGTAWIQQRAGGNFAVNYNIALQPNGGNVGIGTSSPGSALDVKGTLRLSGSSSGYVGLAPAAAAGSTTYTLPAADGTANQVLSTNGAGTLSWQTISASPTTAQVLSATAGASVGAVGTYAFLRETSNVSRAAGATLAGSSLRYSSHQARPSFTSHAQASSGTPSGTWQLMGANSAVYGEADAGMASVWLRIS